MDGAFSHWDVSIGIILLLNIASHYSTVHPINIRYRFNYLIALQYEKPLIHDWVVGASNTTVWLLALIFVTMERNTMLHLQFSMPFIAEIDIKSSGSGYERHLKFF